MIEPQSVLPILMLDDDEPPAPGPATASRLGPDDDPGVLVLTCANCGAAMDERKCKLICR
ncbi:MAG TPA: hypothetical protein VHM48_01500 [Candidatus Limnocylindrales bacterium]|nr:hypothetical protein [Candidatus Limnocylindrales bacterium]